MHRAKGLRRRNAGIRRRSDFSNVTRAYDRGLTGWRRFVPAARVAGFVPSGGRTSTGADPVHRSSETSAASRPSTRTGDSSEERRSTVMYVDRFISSHAADVRGRVLEIAAPDYTISIRTRSRARRHPHGDRGEPRGNDRRRPDGAPHIPDDTFDCAIVTQTMQFIYDVSRRFATVHRILVPEGVLLATVPGANEDLGHSRTTLFGEWWHFTARSVRRLADEAFGERQRRDRDVRQRARRDGVPVRTRHIGPQARGARRARPVLRGRRRTPSSEALGAPDAGASQARSSFRYTRFEKRCSTTPVVARERRAGAGGGRRRPRRGLRPRPHTSPRRRVSGSETSRGVSLPAICLRASRSLVSTTSRAEATPRSTSASETT